jgi:hypothetical protein
MPDGASPLPGTTVYQVKVPRLWGWCAVGPRHYSMTAARNWLSQYGPLDGRITIGGN